MINKKKLKEERKKEIEKGILFMQVAEDKNIREILGWQETEKFIYCLMSNIEYDIENYFKEIAEMNITKEIYKFGLQALEFIKKINEK